MDRQLIVFQKCAFEGIAKLWVREGSICINSAILHESPKAYTIFGSTSGSSTETVAQTRIAEFQLDTVSSCQALLPSVANVPGKLGELARRGSSSFHVLDKAESAEGFSEGITNIDGPIRAISSHIKSASHKIQSAQTTIICGKRSIDTHRLSINLANHLLTDKSQPQQSQSTEHPKIAFLDLDYHSPAFSAPGTASLVILQKPLFGPSYTQPLQYEATLLNHAVFTQYIKGVDDSEKSRLNISCTQSLIETAKTLASDSCLLVRTGSWFAHMSASERSLLSKLLQPTLLVCIDMKKSSTDLETAQSLSKYTPDSTVLHIPIPPNPSLSPLQEHKLLLQSHFRIHNIIGDTPLWYHESLPDLPLSRRLIISTNPTQADGLKFIQVHGGILRPQDIPRAIYQNLVVIMAVEKINDNKNADLPSVSTTTSKSQNHQWHDNITDITAFGSEPGFGCASSGQNQHSKQSLLEIRNIPDYQPLHFIGLAFVEDIDLQGQTITMNTPVARDRLQHHVSLGRDVGLVLEKPGVDGRFGRELLIG